MGFKCSVLGHRYEDTEVEREREEQGSEVVITIRELETCSRCGERRVVSENKEVTSLETPDQAGDDDAATPSDESPTESTGGAPVDAVESGADDAVILDDESDESIPDAESDDAEGSRDRTGEELSASDIVDAGPEPTPNDESDGPADEDGDGQQATETSTDDDDAVILEEGEEDEQSDGRTMGEWPDEPDDDGQSPEEAAAWPDDETLDDEAAAVSESVDDDIPADMTVPEGMYKCTNCGYTTDVESSSLREGDFCPECHRGTLVQQDDG